MAYQTKFRYDDRQDRQTTDETTFQYTHLGCELTKKHLK